ncbi:MAG TPA: PH domain-containing protein [Spirochaetota bacterium]|nr:PH domain-containing protein [Spirochaetota bacterium]HOS32685.1 PH domain-containing protein [Spirochaetota bacterium]HOS56490.1 PH domain-containing protein [Spirochaetota bacterium]HPK61988.1 PH domain-containing protein [Spirochaetota bacterium]HQF78289.1 PH domain-containing protein [Spirochaetota bacterium]
MKKIALLLISFIKNFFYKGLFDSLKKRNLWLFSLKISFFIFIPDVVILIPFFFGRSVIATLLLLITLFAVKYLLVFFTSIRLSKSPEKINNGIIKTSLPKSDLISLISNDIFSNITFNLCVIFLFFIYHIIILSFAFFVLSVGIKTIIINLILYFIAAFLFVNLFSLSFSIINQKRKRVVLKLNDFKEIRSNGVIFYFIIFALLYLAFFYIFGLFKINIFFRSVAPIPFSAVCAYFINKALIKLKILNYLDFHLAKLLKNIQSALKDFFSGDYKRLVSLLKYAAPLAVFLTVYAIFSIAGYFFKSPVKLIFLQSIIIASLSLKIFLVKDSYNLGTQKKAFNFNVYIYLIMFIFTIFGMIRIEPKIVDKPDIIGFFVFPIRDAVIAVSDFINNYILKINIFIYLLIPVFFALFFKLNCFLIRLLEIIDFKVDEVLKRRLQRSDSNILFGDSMSFFYFLFNLTLSIAIIFLIKIESKALSDFFIYLASTFQISEIFNFKFLTDENIALFVNTAINVVIGLILVRLLMQFISTLLSHFILFSDELVYLENKLYSRSLIRIPLTKINYIIIKQNFIERLFDIGAIYIETQDKNGLIKINGIPSIKEKNILIMEKIKIGLQKT